MNITRKQLEGEIKSHTNFTLNRVVKYIDQMIEDCQVKNEKSDNEWYWKGEMTGLRIAKRIVESEKK